MQTIVDGEFFKIGQNAKRQFCAPGIATKLVGRGDISLQRDGGLFSFEKELANSADAEAIVGRMQLASYFQRGFVYYVFVLFGMTLHVAHVPAECFK